MNRSEAAPRGRTERWADALVEGPARSALALGCGVSTGLLLLYLGWEFAFGHLGYLSEHSFWAPETRSQRIALTVIVLTGFMVGTHVYALRELVRDVEDLGPLLVGSPQQHAALVREAESTLRHTRSWTGSLLAVAIGLFVVTGRRSDVPFLLDAEPWDHDVAWALAANVLLFAILGRVAVLTFRTNRFFAKIESLLAPIDLLHLRALSPLARRGLRMAFLWIGGSSIASIIFVNQGFSWLTGLVLVGTLSLGTLAFVRPLRSLRRRIRAAKEAELQRVRVAIRRARDELLEPASAGPAGARLSGLLAYEARIASVSEWPIDAPQVARFGLMLTIGLGSWLGGAVVGHILDAFWR